MIRLIGPVWVLQVARTFCDFSLFSGRFFVLFWVVLMLLQWRRQAVLVRAKLALLG